MKFQVYLTDEQLAELVDWEYAGQTPAEIARALGRQYHTIHQAVQRVRTHSWEWHICCPSCVICVICGRTFATTTVTAEQVCGQAYYDERNRRRSQTQRERHPGSSAPYVRAWRRRHPGKLLAERIRASDRWHGKRKPQSEDQKRRHSAVSALLRDYGAM